MLDVDRLRVFREVARHGSFSAAARTLSFTQPGVSHHVKQLERELGVVLIERSPRGIQLTPPGRALLGHADTLLVRLDDAERDIVEIANHGGGTLRVVAFPTGAATLVPPAVAAFRAALPGVHLQLAEADPPVALPRLAAGEVDLIVAYDYPILHVPQAPALEWEEVLVDDMAVCLPARHALADAETVRLEELEGEQFVAPYDCVCRDALVHACRSLDFAPDVASETNDYMAMQGLVASGVGVAVLPRLVAAIAVRPNVVIRPLASGALARRVSLVVRRDGFRSGASSTMQDLLRSAAADLADGGLGLVGPLGRAAHAA